MADEKAANDNESQEDHKKTAGSGPSFHEYLGSILPFTILFDILSPIPGFVFVGQFVMTVVWLLHGVPPWGKKTWIWYLATWICELIPVVNFLPMFIIESARFYAITSLRRQSAVLSLASRTNTARAYARLQLQKNKAFLERARGRAIEKGGPDKAKQIDDKRRDLNTALSGNQPKTGADGKKKDSQINQLTGKEHTPLVNRLPAFIGNGKKPKQSRAANDSTPTAAPNDPNSGVMRDAA